jgi:hypothetical protein
MADLPRNSGFTTLDRAALRLSEELVQHLEAALQTVADAQTREMLVARIQYRQHARGVVNITGCVGHCVRRVSYRPAGEGNGRACIPSTCNSASSKAARWRSLLRCTRLRKRPDPRCRARLLAAHRSPPSRSTLEHPRAHCAAMGQESARDCCPHRKPPSMYGELRTPERSAPPIVKARKAIDCTDEPPLPALQAFPRTVGIWRKISRRRKRS